MAKKRKGWCPWTSYAKKCPPACGSPTVDNFGNMYPACALVRLKSQAELDAERENDGDGRGSGEVEGSLVQGYR